ncbi:MAG: hypothetical protein QF489_10505 [Planctomycetota bacterium]|jgi:hypothetical protein|nr:hypothetical protein [Planctomycetota bacterium]
MAPSQRFGLAFGTAPRQRKTLAEALGNDLDGALARFTDHITAPAVLDNANPLGTLILDDSGPAFDVAVALQEAAWPVPLRFTLVVAPPAGAAGCDEAVRSKAAVTLNSMDRQSVFCFDLPSKSEEELAMADSTAALHRTLVLGWTETRLHAVRSYRKNGRQAMVAADLNISQQAVSQMLLGANFRRLKRTEEGMRKWLARPQRTMLWPMKRRG